MHEVVKEQGHTNAREQMHTVKLKHPLAALPIGNQIYVTLQL